MKFPPTKISKQIRHAFGTHFWTVSNGPEHFCIPVHTCGVLPHSSSIFITLCFNKFKFVYYSQAAHFTLTWLISHPCCWALHWCSLCKDISLTFVAIIFCSYDSKLFPTGALCAQHLTWIFLGSILLAKFGLMLVQLITTQRITITQLITLDGTLLVLEILVFLTPL